MNPESEKLKRAWTDYESLRHQPPKVYDEAEQLILLNAAVYVALCEWRRWRTRKESGDI